LADNRARFAGLKAAADEAEQQLLQRGARGADFDRDKFERMCVLMSPGNPSERLVQNVIFSTCMSCKASVMPFDKGA
jgi:hypothetical protein